MLQDAVTPPGLWVTLTVIVVASILIYWKRKPIKRWLRTLRVKEVTVGPVKLGLERKPEAHPQPSPPSPLPEKKPPAFATESSHPQPTPPTSPSHPEASLRSPNAMSLSEKEKAELLDLKHRRLHELKKKEALMGINTPPEVLIEIKHLEEETRELEHELKCLEGTREPECERKPEPSPVPSLPPAVPVPADLLAEMLSGDRTRAQEGAARLAEQEEDQHGPLHQALRERLLRTMRDPARPVHERVSAGDALTLVGDPRFRSDAWYLPDEPLLGFVEIPWF